METETHPPTSAESQLLYAATSLRLIQPFKDCVGDTIKLFAKEQARSDGRDLVDADDVIAAIDKLFDKIKGNEDGR